MKHVTSDSGLPASLLEEGYDFYTGVPDSGLKQFIADVQELPDSQHVRATWEGAAIGIAAGHTSPAAAVRLPPERGLGHTVNPLTSLCIPYGIDMLLVVGHRHTLRRQGDGRNRRAAAPAHGLEELRDGER